MAAKLSIELDIFPLMNFSEFSKLSDYSFMNYLKADPQSIKNGND